GDIGRHARGRERDAQRLFARESQRRRHDPSFSPSRAFCSSVAADAGAAAASPSRSTRIVSPAFASPPSKSFFTSARCASSCSCGSGSASLSYATTTVRLPVAGSISSRMRALGILRLLLLRLRGDIRERLAIEHLLLEQEIAQRDDLLAMLEDDRARARAL